MPDNADDAADAEDAGACWWLLSLSADDDCVFELENEEDDELLLLLELELDDVDDADDAKPPPLDSCKDEMAVFEPPDDPTGFANWQ